MSSGELDRIEAPCPHCGTVYHLDPGMIGEDYRCISNCHKQFTVEDIPVTGEVYEDDEEFKDEPVYGMPVDRASDTSRNLNDTLADDDDIPMMPSDAIVAGRPIESSAQPAAPPVQQATREPPAATSGGNRTQGQKTFVSRDQRKLRVQRGLAVLLAAIVLLSGGLAAAVWYRYVSNQPNAEDEWVEIQQLVEEHKWGVALKNLKAFEKGFPDSAHVEEIPYFVDYCNAGDEIFSSRGDSVEGLNILKRIFEKHRDNPAYKSYSADLFGALSRVAKRFLTHAEKTINDPSVLTTIQHARDSFELLKTVAHAAALKKVDWVPEEVSKVASHLATVEQSAQRHLARRRATENLVLATSTDSNVDVDSVYENDERLVLENPELRTDKELLELRQSLYASEASRVRYEPIATANLLEHEADSATTASKENGHRIYVVLGQSTGAASEDDEQRYFALSRGVLYAFDAQGNHRWARPLGVDSHQLPVAIQRTNLNPQRVAVVSSNDNQLIALNVADGSVAWRYPPEPGRQPISASLTTVHIQAGPNSTARQIGLLPVGTEIHAIELVLGKPIGKYDLGYPVSAAGAVEERLRYGTQAQVVNKLVYFPAASKRVFAINPTCIDDPSVAACPSVLYTNHPAGALRSRPTVVEQYLVLTESSDLDRMKIRVFIVDSETGFAEFRMDAAREVSLGGWSWFEPAQTPDRIAVVTDQGNVGVYGLNLNNESNIEESLYSIIGEDDEPAKSLGHHDPFRSLAIHTDEHLLWGMSGGRIHKFFLNIIEQSVISLWDDSDAFEMVQGAPLHKAQMDRFGQTFYLATMSTAGDQFLASSVDAENGAVNWQRQLGVTPATDPLVYKGRGVVLIDDTGRIIGLVPQRERRSRVETNDLRNTLPIGTSGRDLLTIEGQDQEFFLVAPLDEGRHLHVLALNADAKARGDWKEVRFLDPLQGTPGIYGDSVWAPCADGMIYRVRLDGTELNELPIPWRNTEDDPVASQATVVALSNEAVLVCDGYRVRRFEFKVEQGAHRWVKTGQTFTAPRGFIGDPVTDGVGAFVTDTQGTVWQLRLNNPRDVLGSTKFETDRLSAPLIRGDKVFVIEDQRAIACLSLGTDRLSWKYGPMASRIVGKPVIDGQTLIVTDESGRITILSLEGGAKLSETSIHADIGPATAAVPFGDDWLLVPLNDGTLLETQTPKSAEEVARSEE